LIADSEGKVLYKASRDLGGDQLVTFPNQFNLEQLAESPFFQQARQYTSLSGLVMLPDGPLLVSSQPIVRKVSGESTFQGAVLQGRLVTSTEIGLLSDTTHLNITMFSLVDRQIPEDFVKAFEAIDEQHPIYIQPLSEELIAGYAVIDDIYGHAAAILRVVNQRDIYKQGKISSNYLLVFLLATGLGFSLLSLILLEKLVLSRIVRLNHSVARIRASRDLSLRMGMSGSDEIAVLASTMDDMLTELQQSAKALSESESKFRVLAEASAALIFIIQDDRFRYINPVSESILKYRRAKLLRMNYWETIHQENRDEVRQALTDLQAGEQESYRAEIKMLTAGNHKECWVEINARPILYGGQNAVICTGYDITERKNAEEQLRYLSAHDALSGLYNRAFFEEELQRLEKSRHFPISIVIADIDGMKWFNDTMGHAAGDELIRRAAQFFKAAFRAEDVIARIGGDEFAILLPSSGVETAQLAVQRIRQQLDAQPESELRLSLSIGVATGEGGDDVPLMQIMRMADQMMYQEKRRKVRNDRSNHTA
ncbi:MAG: diguanylate cyclase, partial [Chloroflexi bacterium]|nr:diguanylate cyclase [Chloroflexota bacterium]